MPYKLIYPESYIRRARKFLKRHPELQNQYRKTLELLEVDPTHSSLRLHRLKGKLSDLHSVSINLRYRITLEFLIEGEAILLVNVGKHEQVY
jgi:mRNA-degrading endonuclease YafQ of YafQ-DinJ toxin-antitoxin module